MKNRKTKPIPSKAALLFKHDNIRGFLDACNKLLAFMLELRKTYETDWNPLNWASGKKEKKGSFSII